MNFIDKMLVKDEGKFLFLPYSTFTVLEGPNMEQQGVNWTKPYIVVLEAAVDNKLEPEDVPLSMWH